MVVLTMSDSVQFHQQLEQAGKKPVFVDFFATWCGPCRTVAPIFEELSNNLPQAVFLKVDVDKLEDVARAQSITAMPTFACFRESRKMDSLRGGDPAKLGDFVRKWCSASAASIEESADDANPDNIPKGQADLTSFIDQSGSECLNESDDHTLSHSLSSKGGFLESDCDEQLIIAVQFNQLMKLHSIKIAVLDKENFNKAPKTVKVFANLPHSLDFDSAEAMEPVQQFELTEDDLKEDSIINLKYVKFQNVSSVTLFIKDNQGEEETTVIDRLIFMGTPVNTTNMGDFKRVSGKKGESH